ncbi:MAG TPA: integrase core domain-containing protein [Phycisphaerales bacterium]|nr:integrase core domain-containing protein [Phycisphaerales bacterium]
MLRLVDPILFVLASTTHNELARQVQFLKEENRILRAHLPGRVVLTPAERSRLLRLGKALGSAVRELLTVVSYQTFRRWQRGRRKKSKTGSPGRPHKAEELRALVVRLAMENRTWGYSRLLGKLLKLGFRDISRTCVRDILIAHGIQPAPARGGPTWDEFVKAHAKTLWACDYFTRPVLTLTGWKTATVLFFVHIQTRRIIVSSPTLHPDHAWSQRQAEVFIDKATKQGFEPPKILLKDGDGKFGPGFTRSLRAHGCNPKRLPVRTPQLNAYTECWVRSVRRECLDHFIPLGLRHLDYLLRQYTAYYHQERPHQGLGTSCRARGE